MAYRGCHGYVTCTAHVVCYTAEQIYLMGEVNNESGMYWQIMDYYIFIVI